MICGLDWPAGPCRPWLSHQATGSTLGQRICRVAVPGGSQHQLTLRQSSQSGRYITWYHVIHSVRYYTRFHVTAVDLGTYYPWIRRSACPSAGRHGRAPPVQCNTNKLSQIILLILIEFFKGSPYADMSNRMYCIKILATWQALPIKLGRKYYNGANVPELTVSAYIP